MVVEVFVILTRRDSFENMIEILLNTRGSQTLKKEPYPYPTERTFSSKPISDKEVQLLRIQRSAPARTIPR